MESEKIKRGGDFSPERVWEVRVGGYQGWLVQDRLAKGLAFGGFRFGPKVTSDEVCELAQTMTWKLFSHGWPVGGAKAGLNCDPSDPDLPRILREIGKAWELPLKSNIVLGKDMGAMDLFLDSLYEGVQVPQLYLAQKKNAESPRKIREMTGYIPHMTALGAVHACEAATGPLSGKTVAIQGAGAVGAGLVARLHDSGAKILAISDIQGALIWKDGLASGDLFKALNSNSKSIDRSKCHFPHDWEVNSRILDLDVDVLFLAASSGLIDEASAARIRAPVVVEVSNFGIQSSARDLLQGRGVLVIPDVLASSSSAALVAHQLATGNQLSKEKVWDLILAAIRRATLTSAEKAREKGTDVRSAYLQDCKGGFQ